MTEAHFQEVSMTEEEAHAVAQEAIIEVKKIVDVATARIFAARGSILLGDHPQGNLSMIDLHTFIE
jgi:hypothetical protein